MKLHRSLRVWSLYVDLEEGLDNLEATRAIYERILDLRIATPQIIINYAYFLEVCTTYIHFLLLFLWINDFAWCRNTSTLKIRSRFMKEE